MAAGVRKRAVATAPRTPPNRPRAHHRIDGQPERAARRPFRAAQDSVARDSIAQDSIAQDSVV